MEKNKRKKYRREKNEGREKQRQKIYKIMGRI
jgi:hypothetical protein